MLQPADRDHLPIKHWLESFVNDFVFSVPYPTVAVTEALAVALKPPVPPETSTPTVALNSALKRWVCVSVLVRLVALLSARLEDLDLVTLALPV